MPELVHSWLLFKSLFDLFLWSASSGSHLLLFHLLHLVLLSRRNDMSKVWETVNDIIHEWLGGFSSHLSLLVRHHLPIFDFLVQNALKVVDTLLKLLDTLSLVLWQFGCAICDGLFEIVVLLLFCRLLLLSLLIFLSFWLLFGGFCIFLVNHLCQILVRLHDLRDTRMMRRRLRFCHLLRGRKLVHVLLRALSGRSFFLLSTLLVTSRWWNSRNWIKKGLLLGFLIGNLLLDLEFFWFAILNRMSIGSVGRRVWNIFTLFFLIIFKLIIVIHNGIISKGLLFLVSFFIGLFLKLLLNSVIFDFFLTLLLLLFSFFLVFNLNFFILIIFRIRNIFIFLIIFFNSNWLNHFQFIFTFLFLFSNDLLCFFRLLVVFIFLLILLLLNHFFVLFWLCISLLDLLLSRRWLLVGHLVILFLLLLVWIVLFRGGFLLFFINRLILLKTENIIIILLLWIWCIFLKFFFGLRSLFLLRWLLLHHLLVLDILSRCILLLFNSIVINLLFLFYLLFGRLVVFWLFFFNRILLEAHINYIWVRISFLFFNLLLLFFVLDSLLVFMFLGNSISKLFFRTLLQLLGWYLFSFLDHLLVIFFYHWHDDLGVIFDRLFFNYRNLLDLLRFFTSGRFSTRPGWFLGRFRFRFNGLSPRSACRGLGNDVGLIRSKWIVFSWGRFFTSFLLFA